MLAQRRVHLRAEVNVWGFAAAALAATLEIEIPDPQVVAVVLECADGSFKAVVRDGLATFERKPDGCAVTMVRRAGTIDQPGRWRCDLDGCRMKDVHHRPVTDGDGKINIIMASQLAGGASLELQCASGYQVRTPVVENTVVFEGVPKEDCTLHFKGGAPARYKPLTWGTWQCTLDGTVALCIQR